MIIKYQFKDDRPLPPNKRIPVLMSDLKEYKVSQSDTHEIF
jgi:hypothetical protein